MMKRPKNDAVKGFLTLGLNQQAGDYPSGPFNLPPEPLQGGTEIGGAPTTDGAHEYVIPAPRSTRKGDMPGRGGG